LSLELAQRNFETQDIFRLPLAENDAEQGFPFSRNMIIRSAALTDAVAICRLLEQLGYPTSLELVQRKLALLQGDEDEASLVCETDDKKVLGFLSMHYIRQIAVEGNFARISYFCVDKQARSTGIGTALEKEACRIASERGCDRIELHCHSRRTNAHSFYLHRGYEESPKYFFKKLGKPATPREP
jgi:GNAT superfamily N-acetyltransferase